ncbi:MAG: putative CRISPR-associated protein [Calditrichaeota bacterium]|nr:putative CRISPR-associated protein [Calditrichota bacterium]
MTQRLFVLSPCGTSILTNGRNQEERGLINKLSNIDKREHIPEEHLPFFDNLFSERASFLANASNEAAAKISAEINTLIKIYEGKKPANGDFHYLIATDTWLGRETAKLVERWLLAKNPAIITQIYTPSGLQTEKIDLFQQALSDLVRNLTKLLDENKERGYKILFNLTGGFKSVQGFLQSIANFYADETVYIFERSPNLLRIPRLPIKLSSTEIIEENLEVFRRLAIGLSEQQVEDIPETFLFNMGEQTTLSPWGELLWKESKPAIYNKRLLPSPTAKIQFTKRFEKTVNSLSPKKIIEVNSRIDQFYRHLNDPKYNPSSLDFKPLKGNPKPPSTHEIDAWGDKDARRIFGHFENEVFVLDDLDKGLH